MPLLLTRDVSEFASQVEEFLAARVERNVLATVLHTIRARGGYGVGEPLFAIATDERGATVAVALRTPPWPLLAAGFDDAGSARELLEAWLEHDPEPGAISAEPATARALIKAYGVLTGGTSELEFDEAMHALTEVTDPPHPAPGGLRPARADDRPTLVDWEHGFIADAHIGDPEHAQQSVDRRLSSGYQYVWTEPDGTRVSTVAHNLPIAGTARIGPVYTPPEFRGRGYASSAVAALSRHLLESGARRCMLFTDLANPTSNKIYASVGYRRFGDWEQYRLRPPADEVRN